MGRVTHVISTGVNFKRIKAVCTSKLICGEVGCNGKKYTINLKAKKKVTNFKIN